MPRPPLKSDIVRAGSVEGHRTVYGSTGDLILQSGESILNVSTGWDMTATSPWRRFLTGVIFLGFSRKASSRLYITTRRLVLIREIDPWREAGPGMTPLGMPDAIAKKVELEKLSARGIRQFCEVVPGRLRVVKARRSRKAGAWLGLMLLGDDGRKYWLSYWKTDGEDAKTLALLESQFQR